MDSVFQSIATTNFDSNLNDVKQRSLATMEMFGKTFSGILIAFQQQINKDQDLEEKIQTIFSRIDKIDDNLIQTQKSIKNEVNKMNEKLQQQKLDTNKQLQTLKKNVETATKNLQNQCKSMIKDVNEQLKQSAKNVENVQNELNKHSISLQSMSDRVENTLNRVNEKQESIEQEMLETRNLVNDKIAEIEDKITENNKIVFNKIRGIADKFQNLRFEVDQIASKKADVEDLKRKANQSDFNQLNNTVSNITNTFSTNIEEINIKMDDNHKKFQQNMVENKQLMDGKLLSFDEQIDRINNSLGNLEYIIKQKPAEQESDIKNPSNMLQMIHDLQNDVDEIIKANANKGPQVVGATSSGSCFSCGQRITTFPALPTRMRSPDKANIGGGFTFDQNEKKSPSKYNKFSEKMRNELVEIATDLESPNKHHHKFPIERKPVKLPSLDKRNSSSKSNML